MKLFSWWIPILLAMSSPALCAEGMVNVPSSHPVDQSAQRAEEILRGKGMTIFDRIPHSSNASNVGIDLRDTVLIIFGNPKIGSPLMNCRHTVAIDLPQKLLIWQDANQQVWISYNAPSYLAERHDIEGCDEILAKMEKALAGIAKAIGTE